MAGCRGRIGRRMRTRGGLAVFSRAWSTIAKSTIAWMVVICTALFLVAPAPSAHAATVTVQSSADDGTANAANCPGSGCRLRDAISAASSGDSINFSGSFFITLAASQLTIGKDLTINGEDQSVTISGNNTVRVFYVNSGVTFNLQSLTVEKGNAGEGAGGGIYNFTGTVTVQNTTFSGNSATYGAGIFNFVGGTVTAQKSTFSGNAATTGGGIFNFAGGTVTIQNSTFLGNSATDGGGVYNFAGAAAVQNSTFSGNAAAAGGGIYNLTGTVAIQNCTFSGNAAAAGGGIYNPSGTLNLSNTLMANSPSGGDCSGIVVTSDNNLIESTGAGACGLVTGGGSSIGVDPVLGPLGSYGGPTQTFALLPGSPAIDAGNGSTCLAKDQRGLPRVGPCDIGAFEGQGFTLAVTGGNNQSAVINTVFAAPLALNVTSAHGEPVNGGQVTFTVPGSGASVAISGSPATISGNAVSIGATANGATGSYNVTASASGAASVTFALTNSSSATTTTVASAPNPSLFGQPVILTATIATITPGTPTGTVVFKDGITTLGTGTLNASGVATLSITTLTAGNHSTITAVYSGDATFTGSTSAPLTQTVNAIAPTVTTAAVSIITGNSAVGGGTVTSDGGSPVTARGVCYSTSPNPTIAGPHTTDGTGTGSFISAMSGLTPHTTYYLRAYATNAAGISYAGTDLSFITGLITHLAIAAATGNGDIILDTSSAGCGFTTWGAKTEAQVDKDPAYFYPYGLVAFTLNCAAADVTITFPGSIAGTVYRKYGPTTPGDTTTTAWYTFNNVTVNNSSSVTLHLQDGQLGDDTGVDGIIVDQGGIGQPRLNNTNITSPVPTLTEWGMIVFMLLAGLGSVYYLKRQNGL